MNVPPSPRSEDQIVGDRSGLLLPDRAEALISAGPGFLTAALRSSGLLGADNQVTAITRAQRFEGGNSGDKLFLDVAYARAESDLQTCLFVKFSRDFTDAFRDRRRYELEAEVRLALLSRHPNFPVAVPRAYFADFHRASGTGLLITERIAFGSGAIEAVRRKCRDYELTEALSYYEALVRANARLAAAHKSGALGDEVEALFPLDRTATLAENSVRWTEQELRDRVARYGTFARRCERLLPAQATTASFLVRFEREARDVLRNEAAIRSYLTGDLNYIALAHWNAHIDNAWFWRDATGERRCGLLDWGGVRQLPVFAALWGCLCGADLDIWDNHIPHLLSVFAGELEAHGGPRLPLEAMMLRFGLHLALLGVAQLMVVPELILDRVPGAADAASPQDPIVESNDVARGFLQIFRAFLAFWEASDITDSLARMLAESGETTAARDGDTGR